jgi:hypothetical protein
MIKIDQKSIFQQLEISRTRRAREFSETAEAIRNAVGAPITDVAAKIIRAGQLRRGEIQDPRTLPPPGSLAEQIIRAGKKRRGEVETIQFDDTPAGKLAAQIIAAGKKRRNEI